MKIIVLGAGVIGVSSAYYLAKAGHQVIVIDRQKGPALETSFANAGEVTPGYTAPWAAPGIPLKVLKWMFTKHAPLVIGGLPNWAALRWMAQMMANCRAERYSINKERMVRLAEFSRECLKELRNETGISYDHGSLGTLHLFRTPKTMRAVTIECQRSSDVRTHFELLDAAGCIAAEPGLAFAEAEIAGGIRLRDDETGDCYLFTLALAALAEQFGAQFLFNFDVLSLRRENSRIVAVETSDGDLQADAYVAAMGSYTPALLAPLGVHLPVYPLKGYSLTLPIVDDARSPKSTVLDETYKIAITRLGNRIRVGGMAEISGFNTDLPRSRCDTLLLSVESLFGRAGDRSKALYWSGLRPMTPDGPPVIGTTRYSNLFLNTGHGTFGWTMACGSGHVLADIVNGSKPSISVEGLSVMRYDT